MPGSRAARQEALLQRAKLLREEYRELCEELNRIPADDANEDADEQRARIGRGLATLGAFRARLEALPAEVAQTGYFADLEEREEQMEDRLRFLIRRQAQLEAARVRRELTELLGIDTMSDEAREAEAGAAALRETCAAGARLEEERRAEQAAREEAERLAAAEREAEARSRQDHQDRWNTLSKLLDERDEEVRELRRALARAQARSEEDQRRDREEAVAQFLASEEYAERLAAAHAAGRELERLTELEERKAWRQRRDEAERQYAEVAAGRAQGAMRRQAAFAAQEQSLSIREKQHAEMVQTINRLKAELARATP